MQEFFSLLTGVNFKGSCHCWTKYNIGPLMFCNGRISFKSYLQSSVLSDLKAERAVETGPRKQFLLSYCALRAGSVPNLLKGHLQYRMLLNLIYNTCCKHYRNGVRHLIEYCLRSGIDIILRNPNVHFFSHCKSISVMS